MMNSIKKFFSPSDEAIFPKVDVFHGGSERRKKRSWMNAARSMAVIATLIMPATTMAQSEPVPEIAYSKEFQAAERAWAAKVITPPFEVVSIDLAQMERDFQDDEKIIQAINAIVVEHLGITGETEFSADERAIVQRIIERVRRYGGDSIALRDTTEGHGEDRCFVFIGPEFTEYKDALAALTNTFPADQFNDVEQVIPIEYINRFVQYRTILNNCFKGYERPETATSDEDFASSVSDFFHNRYAMRSLHDVSAAFLMARDMVWKYGPEAAPVIVKAIRSLAYMEVVRLVESTGPDNRFGLATGEPMTDRIGDYSGFSLYSAAGVLEKLFSLSVDDPRYPANWPDDGVFAAAGGIATRSVIPVAELVKFSGTVATLSAQSADNAGPGRAKFLLNNTNLTEQPYGIEILNAYMTAFGKKSGLRQ